MQKFNKLMSSIITGLHLSRSVYIASLAVFIFSALSLVAVNNTFAYVLENMSISDNYRTAYVVKSADTRSCSGDKSFEKYYLRGIVNGKVSYDRYTSDGVIYNDENKNSPKCDLDRQFICTSGLRLDCSENKKEYRWVCYKYITNRKSYSHDRLVGKKQQVNCLVKKDTQNGVCGSKIKTCFTGEPTKIKTTKNGTTWTCEGQGTGKNASCSNLVVNGVCGTKLKNTCKSGEFKNGGETATQFTWTCIGKNAGSDTACAIKK